MTKRVFTTLVGLMTIGLILALAGPAQAELNWDFWHDGAGDPNGWTLLMGYDDGTQGYRDGDGGGVGPDGPTTNGANFAWDHQHPNFLFESPAFNFDGSTLDGTNVLRIVSNGGEGQQGGSISPYNNPGEIPAADTATNGLKGWAFLNTSTNQYDATLFKTGNGAATQDFTGAALTTAGVNLSQEYRLHFYETDHGGWGWTQLNEVNIAGNMGPVTHEVGGDNTIDTETLTGTQGNETYGGGITGARFVRVVQNLGETFQVAELQAFETGTGINKAEQSQGGVATAKDNAHGGVPPRANDGNTNMQWGGGSIWHSGSTTGTWLQIELAADTDLDKVHFWGREDCCENRQGDFNLIIEDASNVELYNERILGINAEPNHREISVAPLLSADLTASLAAHDAGAGYTYVFELSSNDQITVDNPDPGVYTTYLDINNADIVVEALGPLTPGEVFVLLDADHLIGTYNSLTLPTGVVPVGNFWETGAVIVPEPSTLLLAAIGLLGLLGVVRRAKSG